MNAVATKSRTGFKFLMTVREGPDTGASFQLLPPRVSIGRGAENSIVLNDPRMSRNAAVIEFSMERIIIKDVSARQSLSVNGDFCVEASIKDRDTIRIGETELVFVVEAIQLVPQALIKTTGPDGRPLQIVPPSGFGPQEAPPPPPPTMKGPSHSAGMSPMMKMIIGLVVIGAALFLMKTEKDTAKKKSDQIRTTEEIEEELKKSQVKIDELDKKRVFKSEDERTRFNEAQKHFFEGFRDYQKNQWVRAMRSFETAIAIDPQHIMAARYYKLSEKQRDERIALLTLEGRRYLEKAMYTRCSAQFEKVLDMIPNKKDVKYKSAEQLKKECDKNLEGQIFR